MKLRRSTWLLAALASLSGCEIDQFGRNQYTRLVVTNPRGGLIADWVARGPIVPNERGYRITAVQRISGPPDSILSRYPDGWRTTAVGPNIHHWRCPAPEWLEETQEITSGYGK